MIIKKLRKDLDEIDKKIVILLGKRRTIIKKVADYKKNTNTPVFDPGREKEIYQRVRKLAEENTLCPDFIENIFQQCIAYFRSEEERDLKKD